VASLGRYAELYGDAGVDADLLNRAFEIPRQAQADYPKVEPKFCNPADPTETWSGRGKQPHWVRNLIRLADYW